MDISKETSPIKLVRRRLVVVLVFLLGAGSV
jgi:hypothetical protein